MGDFAHIQITANNFADRSTRPRVAQRSDEARQDVEVGINRVWGTFKLDKIIIFDDLHWFMDELLSYSRELDDMGEPTEKIDCKDSYHVLDAVRYVISYLHPDKPKETMFKSPVARPGLQNL